MKYLLVIFALLPVLLGGCASRSERGTLAELKGVTPRLKDAKVVDGLDKAMASYRHFLKQAPNSVMTPDALRRIADLDIEKEYGFIGDDEIGTSHNRAKATATGLTAPTTADVGTKTRLISGNPVGNRVAGGPETESDAEFEKRVAHEKVPSLGGKRNFDAGIPAAGDDLANATAEQAISIYKRLLAKYPDYQSNDQVLYQMARAYANTGQLDAEMAVMRRFVRLFPTSRYIDEIEFRIAEYCFARRKYMDAEDAYKSVVMKGPGSPYFELALYKLGWTYYKQQMYEEALNKFFALLDHKVETGYDFSQKHDETENERIEDTYRVISLSFSNLGGPKAVADYFSRHGTRSYEDEVYSHLGEFYLAKRRYSDAAGAYQAFVRLHPFARVSPEFSTRVIQIYAKGGFGDLVVSAKKAYAKTYALNAPYWDHYDASSRPDVVASLKQDLDDLATFYHARYQNKKYVKDKQTNYAQALLWYRNYLASFPRDKESPAINYRMADLMLENGDFGSAAAAYEATAYNYPPHKKSAAAGYAAVYAYRQALTKAAMSQKPVIKQQIIRSSLKFADTFPHNAKVPVVLGGAADDLYDIKDYPLAVKTARRLIKNYPKSSKELMRSAWLVVGQGSFAQALYADAEQGYHNALALTPKSYKSRSSLVDNLAAAIYKQGEQANEKKDYQAAADNFLRVSKLAPTSKILPAAEYHAAAALIELKEWDRAARVLLAFRAAWPNNKLQPQVTKNIAFVYRSAGKLKLAAAEYERMERENKDPKVERGALEEAADLYKKVGAKQDQLSVYRRYVDLFPKPIGPALEMYNEMSQIYHELGDDKDYKATLVKIVSIDSGAGKDRTDRSRYLAAEAKLVLTRPIYDRFASVKLVDPLKRNLTRKRNYMKAAIAAYKQLLDYEVADVTAASTYYIGQIYLNFGKSLLASQRPTNLSKVEMNQYEVALENQAYPFEDKAIQVQKKNIELLHSGVYSPWIDKSISVLAKLSPAAYARTEVHTGYIDSIDSFDYVIRNAKPASSTKSRQKLSMHHTDHQVTAAAARGITHG